MTNIVPIEQIASKIYFIRGVKVMLDRDLAELYEVETKRLKEQVKRNIDRFPDDFMFELTKDEFRHLRSQIATSSWGGPRYVPMVFTEQGIAMLSTVLRSKRAIKVNIHIMRAFVKLRRFVLDSESLRNNIGEIKKELEELRNQSDERFQIVFETLDRLLTIEEKPKRKIGF